MGVDLQLQIYILSGVFSLIFIIIIFFLAGICGQISKLKHEHLKTNCDHMRHTGYENYAYSSRTIQSDEELNRRGYKMYEPNNSTNKSRRLKITEKEQRERAQNITEYRSTGEECNDVADEYSIANTETVVMSGKDMEMKIKPNCKSDFKVTPPPGFRNAVESDAH